MSSKEHDDDVYLKRLQHKSYKSILHKNQPERRNYRNTSIISVILTEEINFISVILSLMAQIATLQKMVQQAQQPQPQQFVQRLPPTSNIQNQPFMQNPQQQYPQQQVVTKKTGRTTELTGETQIEFKNET